MSYISYLAENETNTRKNLEKNLENKYHDVVQKIDSLGELYLDPDNSDESLMTKEEFKEKKLRYEKEKKKILKSVGKVSRKQDNTLAYFANAAELARELVKKFNKDDIEYKRKLLIDLGRTMIIKDKKVYLEPRLPFIQFNKMKDKVKANPEWLELNPANRDKDIQLFEEIRTVWSGERDSNP